VETDGWQTDGQPVPCLQSTVDRGARPTWERLQAGAFFAVTHAASDAAARSGRTRRRKRRFSMSVLVATGRQIDAFEAWRNLPFDPDIELSVILPCTFLD
jgi:hypothetical protein